MNKTSKKSWRPEYELFDPARGRFEPVWADAPDGAVRAVRYPDGSVRAVRHVRKTEQDRLPVEQRARVAANETRKGR